MILTADEVKQRARELGADAVGIASAAALNAHPPDPKFPQTPERISPEIQSVVAIVKRIPAGAFRTKRPECVQYMDQLVLREMDKVCMRVAQFLEEEGAYAFPLASQETKWEFKRASYGYLSGRHVAVEAGLGTLGLNLMLLTQEYGPRVLLTAVLTSAQLELDPRMTTPLCLGEECGRCLLACPGDAILQWGLDKKKCASYASPYGFSKVVEHVGNVVRAGSVEEQVELLRSGDSFNIWQTILRGVGAYTGCTRCEDVCPVGQDYARHLQDIQQDIPEATPEKEARLEEMRQRRAAGEVSEGREHSRRWIGEQSTE